MITGGIMRFPPPPAVSDKPPRLWKSLGVLLQDHTGHVEAHYAMRRFDDELDVDREAELRDDCTALYRTLVASGVPINGNQLYELQYGKRKPLVRLVVMARGEITFAGGRS